MWDLCHRFVRQGISLLSNCQYWKPNQKQLKPGFTQTSMWLGTWGSWENGDSDSIYLDRLASWLSNELPGMQMTHGIILHLEWHRLKGKIIGCLVEQVQRKRSLWEAHPVVSWDHHKLSSSPSIVSLSVLLCMLTPSWLQNECSRSYDHFFSR